MYEMNKKLAYYDFQSMDELNSFMNKQHQEPFVPANDEERAQMIAYEAYQTDDPEMKAHLVQEALSYDEENIDALILQAQAMTDPIEKEVGLLNAANTGLRAGLRKEGQDDNESLWAAIEVRPALRAQEALGDYYQEAWEIDKAIGAYDSLLHFNPQDQQGIRFKLMTLYLEKGDLKNSHELLAMYPSDDSADFHYARVLLNILEDKPQSQVSTSLEKAVEANPYVASILNGEMELPEEIPNYYSPGTFEEAAVYLDRNIHLWAGVDLSKW